MKILKTTMSAMIYGGFVLAALVFAAVAVSLDWLWANAHHKI
jgi:hypothetical protein